MCNLAKKTHMQNAVKDAIMCSYLRLAKTLAKQSEVVQGVNFRELTSREKNVGFFSAQRSGNIKEK